MTASRSGAITTAQDGIKTAAAGAPGSTKMQDGPGGRWGVGQEGGDGNIVDVTGPGVATQAFMARVVVPAPAPEDPRVAVVRMLADAIVAAVAAGDLVGAAAATEGLARMLERLESVGTGGETASVRRLR